MNLVANNQSKMLALDPMKDFQLDPVIRRVLHWHRHPFSVGTTPCDIPSDFTLKVVPPSECFSWFQARVFHSTTTQTWRSTVGCWLGMFASCPTIGSTRATRPTAVNLIRISKIFRSHWTTMLFHLRRWMQQTRRHCLNMEEGRIDCEIMFLAVPNEMWKWYDQMRVIKSCLDETFSCGSDCTMLYMLCDNTITWLKWFMHVWTEWMTQNDRIQEICMKSKPFPRPPSSTSLAHPTTNTHAHVRIITAW